MDTIPNLAEMRLEQLLEASLQRLSDLIDECEKNDLLWMARSIRRNFSLENRSWYNPDLCEKLAERVIREEWPIEATATISWTLSAFPFLHAELLDYLSSLIVNNKSTASLMGNRSPSYLLLPFSSTRYKPSNFGAMMEVILSSPQLKLILNDSEVRNFVLYFAIPF